MRKGLLGLLLTALFAFTSCEDDEIMPAYTQELVELVTDASGDARKLVFDDGHQLAIMNHVGNLTPDSIYRVRAMYIPTDNGAELRAAQLVVSSFPVEMDSAMVQTDPLELKSIWGSPRYVNMLVGVKTGGGSQMMGFVDQGVSTLPGGIRKQHIALFHDQTEDPLYYTENVYLSCPTYHLSDSLIHGRDSVEMVIHTFKGIIRKSFLY